MEALRRLDAWIQRHFDACVHWVMLTLGVTKGFVRYALRLLCVFGFLGLAAATAWHWLFTTNVVVWLATAEMDRWLDRMAERSDTLSRADADPDDRWKLVVTPGALYVWTCSACSSFDARDAYILLTTAGLVGAEYIKRTQPKPPEKHQRSLVPQTEGA